VVIAAPSGGRGEVAETKSVLAELADDPDALFRPGEEPRVLSMGGGVKIPRAGKRQAPVSVDMGNRVEALLGSGRFDIVHVHDPFVPGFSSTALRHSFSLNVGTFHETEERPFATQFARPLLEIFFGRLDARTASSRTSAKLLNRYFPGSYEITHPGVDPVAAAQSDELPLKIAFSEREEPGALRLFLRALRRLPTDLEWTATIYADEPGEVHFRVAQQIRERIKVIGPDQASLADLLSHSDVFVAASNGPRPDQAAVRQAIVSGAVPVTTTIGRYVELMGDGQRGLLFPAGDPVTLAGQIQRLGDDRELRDRLRGEGRGFEVETWPEVAERFEAIYERLVARRQDPTGNEALRKKLRERPLIDVDLHMHTDHSSDCATPVKVLIETARDRGFGAIAVTDHNEVSGAQEAAEIVAEMNGFKIIVAEEVMTGDAGEVIGLFLKEKIPKGVTMREAIDEIKRQGGLVYVPHPFDRLHSVPDYENLLEIVEDIDLMEVFNPRVAISSFNEEAERFARKYNIIPAAGSDSHVAQGLGAVRNRLHDFEGPEEFLESMREAEITRRHKNLVYVQALKFIQTTGRPKAAKREVDDPRAVKGGRRKSRAPRQARNGRRARGSKPAAGKS
jgi:predicted metal-dependent phosphoesterase TrpH/glycosyltransferase involved in cell wall biosynthesis